MRGSRNKNRTKEEKEDVSHRDAQLSYVKFTNGCEVLVVDDDAPHATDEPNIVVNATTLIKPQFKSGCQVAVAKIMFMSQREHVTI